MGVGVGVGCLSFLIFSFILQVGEIWLGGVGGELFERGVGVRRTCVIKMVFLWE